MRHNMAKPLRGHEIIINKVRERGTPEFILKFPAIWTVLISTIVDENSLNECLCCCIQIQGIWILSDSHLWLVFSCCSVNTTAFLQPLSGTTCVCRKRKWWNKVIHIVITIRRQSCWYSNLHLLRTSASLLFYHQIYLVCFSHLLCVSPFKRSFSRWIWVSRYQNVSILDFIGAKVDGGGEWWQLEL